MAVPNNDPERIDGYATRLLGMLEDLDILNELGPLSENEARLYFAIERTLYPENEMFRPENLAATERNYLKRTAGISRR